MSEDILKQNMVSREEKVRQFAISQSTQCLCLKSALQELHLTPIPIKVLLTDESNSYYLIGIKHIKAQDYISRVVP